jgi:hypothetical protein
MRTLAWACSAMADEQSAPVGRGWRILTRSASEESDGPISTRPDIATVSLLACASGWYLRLLPPPRLAAAAAKPPVSMLNVISPLALWRRGADGCLLVKSFSGGIFFFQNRPLYIRWEVAIMASVRFNHSLRNPGQSIYNRDYHSADRTTKGCGVGISTLRASPSSGTFRSISFSQD